MDIRTLISINAEGIQVRLLENVEGSFELNQDMLCLYRIVKRV